MISNEAITTTTEGFDTNSSHLCWPNKRQRHDIAPTSSRFKGVVLQQNGHWGAQIYANHQRIWLGTFKSEKAAAMAYDSAAIKLRSGDSHRNFPWTHISVQEPNFQDLYTTEAVLNMIKDGSYESKFSDFVRTRSSKMAYDDYFDFTKRRFNEGVFCQQLFQKELTPSDVGKLNRLVIPKKHALKYFPQVSEASTEGEDDVGGIEDIQLVFFDKRLRSWKFRYCYWKSSQSFVFTRGWNRFVKEKELKAKDVVTFYKCEYRQGLKDVDVFCMIDVAYYGSSSGTNNGFTESFGVGEKLELQLSLGRCSGSGSGQEERRDKEEEDEVVVPLGGDEKGVRLFGLQIS